MRKWLYAAAFTLLAAWLISSLLGQWDLARQLFTIGFSSLFLACSCSIWYHFNDWMTWHSNSYPYLVRGKIIDKAIQQLLLAAFYSSIMSGIVYPRILVCVTSIISLIILLVVGAVKLTSDEIP